MSIGIIKVLKIATSCCSLRANFTTTFQLCEQKTEQSFWWHAQDQVM